MKVMCWNRQPCRAHFARAVCRASDIFKRQMKTAAGVKSLGCQWINKIFSLPAGQWSETNMINLSSNFARSHFGIWKKWIPGSVCPSWHCARKPDHFIWVVVRSFYIFIRKNACCYKAASSVKEGAVCWQWCCYANGCLNKAPLGFSGYKILP